MIRPLSFFLLALAVVTTAEAGAPPKDLPPIAVTFGAHSVTAKGTTPGGNVLFASLGEAAIQWSREILWLTLVEHDASGQGEATLTTTRPIATTSVWAVIDLTSGNLTLASPPGFPLRRLDFPGNGMARGISGQLERLDLNQRGMFIVWVRPGVGAWSKRVGDGGAADDDHTIDGKVRASAENMLPIGSSGAAPKHFLPHDTVVVFNPSTYEIFSTEVPN